MHNPHIRHIGFFRRVLDQTYAFVNTLSFKSSKDYWEKRYAHGGNSGGGSYGKLAQFKAEIINGFIKRYSIHSAVEFGCGDGNQIGLLDNNLDYLGLDVSATAIAVCQQKFINDNRKRFLVYDAQQDLDPALGIRAEMSLSLDVIFHLVEDAVFKQYLRNLFNSAEHYVLIYSTNQDSKQISTLPHVRHRRFRDHVATAFSDWTLIEQVPNRYPLIQNKDGSDAEFFLYRRSD
ncbi:MAG: class I SAM-dependent methyltransferase [Gammaproteobacteria bacterium]|nr:class I SAM-dependent methyltransferase [Gammaproteobacteria bacterium]